jgi:hypothetical protein
MIDKNHLVKWFRSIGVREIEFHYVIKSQYLKKVRPSFGIFNVFFGHRLLARGKHTRSDSF